MWLSIADYFGLRGRETTAQLTNDSFSFAFVSDGRNYAFANHPSLSKNARASLSRKEFENISQGETLR